MPPRKRPIQSPAPYHHGDLRRALLDSAKDILAETGRWDFSLREVARRACVSHNAPYKHFADKDALLAAIGVAGYDALREHNIAAVKGITALPLLLSTLGKAYIQFGIANPALYRLMFGQTLAKVSGPPPAALLEAVSLARGLLRDVIMAGARDGSFNVDPDNAIQVRAATISAWSLVHGLTLLTIDNVVQRDTGAEKIEHLPDEVVDMFIEGLCKPRVAAKAKARKR